MMVISLLLSILVSILLFTTLIADEKDYSDSMAISQDSENLFLESVPTVDMNILTSNSYLAGTEDTIYVTFVGDFASSGPHALSGPFTEGTFTAVSVMLDRVIGRLQRVIFHTDGTDGWLLAELLCTIQGIAYTFLREPGQWLDSLSPSDDANINFSSGYEPNAKGGLREIPASSTLSLDVISSYYSS
jgi:hypothetical protein